MTGPGEPGAPEPALAARRTVRQTRLALGNHLWERRISHAHSWVRGRCRSSSGTGTIRAAVGFAGHLVKAGTGRDLPRVAGLPPTNQCRLRAGTAAFQDGFTHGVCPHGAGSLPSALRVQQFQARGNIGAIGDDIVPFRRGTIHVHDSLSAFPAASPFCTALLVAFCEVANLQAYTE